MAGTQVFAITELLETILLNLPMLDLLFTQQVCKHWHDTISDSSRLQKALFLAPGQRADAWPYANHPQPGNTVCVTPSMFIINSLLLANMDDAIILNTKALNAPDHASCHRMLLSQPPFDMRASFKRRFKESARFESVYEGGDEVRVHILDIEMQAGEHLRALVDQLHEEGWFSEQTEPEVTVQEIAGCAILRRSFVL